ncbi:MAG: transporter substrate-binding domain-containing protein [Gammaproteobacteria bacterium]|nr:transporter substrate-binding domain-containing protein [Gammaproteobacteria bacterium]MBU0814110.1 transporter substrate-binding domain-containing protein [Gammaproteobacteria bacterium]MBU1786370.1 transporter substrate-binding domain-containing protein [Gammaproteobacteria bacterium]
MNNIRRLSLLLTFALAATLAGCSTFVPAVDPEVRQALAPTGKLRVGVYMGSPTSMVLDAKSGQKVGVSLDLGRELARQLGVPFEPVEYRRVAEVIDAMKTGAVDFTFTNATAARAKDVDFTAPLIDLELGYLVPPNSVMQSPAEADRPGMRIGVSQGSSSQGTLTREYKHATVVPASSLQVAAEMMKKGELQAFATNKAILFEMSDGLPGFRVLDGRWGLEHLAIAIPKGRERGMAYLRQFAAQAKDGALLPSIIEKSGLRGTAKATAP